MSSFDRRPRHWFPPSATLLTIVACLTLTLFVVWAIVGFIAVP